jgi:hypothetical protein
VVALLANALFLFLQNPFSDLEPDGSFYLAVAKSIAAGKGYYDPSNFWPDTPTLGRAPAWPAAISVGLTLFPSLKPDFVVRALAGLCNVAISLLLVSLSQVVFRYPRYSVASGIIYALFPSALYLAGAGLSENLFVLLIAMAFRIGFAQTRVIPISAFLMGCGCLARSNFLLFAPIFAVLSVLRVYKHQPIQLRSVIIQMVLFGVCFLVPPSLWVVRNYVVSGNFPVLSTIRGETFYGAYNEVTLHSVDNWGYWVFPDDIPGETKKRDLAKSNSEKELDDYYYARGQAFLRTHILEMPRLLLGRLIRSYVPIPWRPSVGLFGAAAYRALLYLAVLATIAYWRRKLPPEAGVFIVSLCVVNLLTTIIFYGTPRFAFNVEPFLIPLAVIGIAERFRKN